MHKQLVVWIVGIIAALAPVVPTMAESRQSPIDTRVAQANPLQIAGVKLTVNNGAIQVNLATATTTKIETTTQTQANNYYIDIPNGVLTLPDGKDFQAQNPVAGITSVSVTQFSPTVVRVSIVGKTAAPTAAIIAEERGLSITGTPANSAEIADDVELEVIVTATRSRERPANLPRSTVVITRQEIQEQARLTNNLVDILGKFVPGLAAPTQQPSTRTFTLRGRKALILIDNVPQNPNSGFNRELNSISPSVIDRIEVVLGPSATFGGGATGGIINIITKRPIAIGSEHQVSLGVKNEFGNKFLAGDGWNNNLAYTYSVKEGNGDLIFSASQDTNRSFYDGNGNRIPPNQLNDRDAWNIFAKVGYDLDPSQRIQLSYFNYRENVNTEFRSDPAILSIPGLQTARAQQVGPIAYDRPPALSNQQFNLTYTNKNILNSDLSAQLYYRDSKLVQTFSDLRGRPFPAFFPLVWQTSLDATEIGSRVQLQTPISPSISMTWGVDYAREENNRPLLISDPATLDRDRALRINSIIPQTPFFTLDKFGAFSQLKWDISDRWIASGGLRYDRFGFSVGDFNQIAFRAPGQRFGGTTTNESVSANAGIVYKVTPEVNLFASYAQGFALPDLFNAFSSLNPGARINTSILLTPQKVDNYEIGVRGNWQNFQASIAGFQSTSSLGDTIRINSRGETETERAPQRNYGLEALVEYRPSKDWKLGTGITWSEGENDANVDGIFLPLSSITVAPLKVSLFAEHQTTDTWKNRLQLLYVGDRSRALDANVEPFKIHSYATFDLLSTLKLGDGSLELGIENLLNSQYLPVSSQERTGQQELNRFAGRGRTLSVRYSLTF